MSEFKYEGSELDLFSIAHNWKRYWAQQIRPYIGGDVLEVGAGIGANTSFMDTGERGRWLCLEPDPTLAAQIEPTLKESGNGRRYEVQCGTVQSLDSDSRFDTIIYIDVLEHIKEDRRELEMAAARLRPGGRLIVLSPAHQGLFTPFDAAIGHFRRYDKRMLCAISPAKAPLVRIWYMDSVGLLLSLSNRLLLKQSMPTKGQLHVWDKWVIPISRVLDPCLFGRVGKTIVAVWRTEA